MSVIPEAAVEAAMVAQPRNDLSSDDITRILEAAAPHIAVEAVVNLHGRASNPKWDHPIFGYETFFEDQKAYLREQARIELGYEPPAVP